jgi:hypothetical protein
MLRDIVDIHNDAMRRDLADIRSWATFHPWTPEELLDLPDFLFAALDSDLRSDWPLVMRGGKVQVNHADCPSDDEETRRTWFAELQGRAAVGREVYDLAAAARAGKRVTRLRDIARAHAEQEDRRTFAEAMARMEKADARKAKRAEAKAEVAE